MPRRTSQVPPPRRRTTVWIVLGLLILGIGIVVAMLVARGRLFGPDVIAVDAWALSDPAWPSASMKVRWISVPLASASGTVYGLVEDHATLSVVAIDGANGQPRWRTAIVDGAPLSGYRHGDGWNRNDAGVSTEFVPQVPVLGLAGGRLWIAYDHDWATFDADTGAPRANGTLAASLPPVDPAGGFCALGADAWIAMADGRDGGLRITAAGTQNGQREDRPAECKHPIATKREPYGHRTSPLQQARTSRVPDACMRKATRRARSKSNQCKLWGQTPGGIDFADDYGASRFGDKAFAFERPRDTLASVSVEGIESAAETLFVTLRDARPPTAAPPSPTSFEAPAPGGYRYRFVLVSLARDLKPRWLRALATVGDGWGHPLVVAADPAAPAQYLYLFTPGSLAALDRESGEPKFRIALDPQRAP